jgi:antitoxin component YwqK of YwqJK toxin-antitoxin module
MNLKIVTIIFLLAYPVTAVCQTDSDINKTDQKGRKQGHWIKTYPGKKSILYDGYFVDNHPVGEFRRYYDDNTIKSILVFSADGKEANASIYHPNGFISSKGKYINQKKEGKWQFFSISINGYLICEEYYTGNQKNGLSLKFFPDSTVAEKINYVRDIRQGEWLQYYPSGAICVKSSFLDNMINGKFEVWYENGKIEFSGQYKDDVRDGIWFIYTREGALKYKIQYLAGVTKDLQMDIDESDYLDSLELNKGKIADPEKTGIIW